MSKEELIEMQDRISSMYDRGSISRETYEDISHAIDRELDLIKHEKTLCECLCHKGAAILHFVPCCNNGLKSPG